MTLKPGLSGFIPIRNGDDLGYPWREAAFSLLPVCDEVIISDGGSTDGTREAIQQWASIDPKIKLLDYPWPKLPTPDEVERDDLSRPPGDPRFLVTWLNFIRKHCEFSSCLHLDADEILCSKSHDVIRQLVREHRSAWFYRINFWPMFPGDMHTIAPHGTVCGERVVYLGPTELECVSDEPRFEGEPPIRVNATDEFVDKLRIFHVGFMRNQEAFLKKSRICQAAIHSCYDPRLRQAEKTGESWIALSPFPAEKPMLSYPHNDIPRCLHEWLRRQGFNPT
jgi:hypothetical protein